MHSSQVPPHGQRVNGANGRAANGYAANDDGSPNGHGRARRHLGDTSAAIEFLKRRPPGRIQLGALHPIVRSQEFATFEWGDWDGMAAWIEPRQGSSTFISGRTNRARGSEPRRPLSRISLSSSVWPWTSTRVQGKPVDEERKHFRALIDDRIANHPTCAPSEIVDTGGGYQLFWYLPEKLPWAEHHERIRAITRGLVDEFEGDDNATPGSHLFRLPGTVNIPNESKRERGRTVSVASVIAHADKTTSADALAEWIPPRAPQQKQQSDGKLPPVDMAAVMEATEYSELPEALRSKFEAAKARDERLARCGTTEISRQ